jgi:hypothetical protein
MMATPMSSARTDNTGMASKRSQLQLQLYVNRRAEALNAAVLEALPELAALQPVLAWVSPREQEKFREYRDGAFLEAIGRPELRPKLRQYWPARGPRWDALAVARTAAGEWLGPVLVEGKSHVPEMYDRKGCRAAGSRRDDIAAALRATREWLGVPHEVESWWMGGLYQSANRLAFLRFRSVLGERAWLVNAYFLKDPHARSSRAIPERRPPPCGHCVSTDQSSRLVQRSWPRSRSTLRPSRFWTSTVTVAVCRQAVRAR